MLGACAQDLHSPGLSPPRERTGVLTPARSLPFQAQTPCSSSPSPSLSARPSLPLHAARRNIRRELPGLPPSPKRSSICTSSRLAGGLGGREPSSSPPIWLPPPLLPQDPAPPFAPPSIHEQAEIPHAADASGAFQHPASSATLRVLNPTPPGRCSPRSGLESTGPFLGYSGLTFSTTGFSCGFRAGKALLSQPLSSIHPLLGWQGS